MTQTKEKTHQEEVRGVERLSSGDHARFVLAILMIVGVATGLVLMLASIGVNLGGSHDYVSCTGRWPEAVKVTTDNGNATLLARQHFQGLPEQMVANAISNLNPNGINAAGGAWLPGECNGQPPTGV